MLCDLRVQSRAVLEPRRSRMKNKFVTSVLCDVTFKQCYYQPMPSGRCLVLLVILLFFFKVFFFPFHLNQSQLERFFFSPLSPEFLSPYWLFNFIFLILWLCWVFVSVQELSLVVASGGHSSSRCAGLSLSRPLLLRSTGSRRTGSVIVAHGPSCSAACGIFPDQGSNPCPLHWQADSQPLRHQGSPLLVIFAARYWTHLFLNYWKGAYTVNM